MAGKRLASADISSANTPTQVYRIPADTEASCNILVTNRNPSSARVRVSIGDNASPENKDYIEYDVSIPAYGVLERSGLIIGALERIIVESSDANISVRIHGYETASS